MLSGTVSSNAFRFLDIRSPKANTPPGSGYVIERSLLLFPETPFEHALKGVVRGANYAADLAGQLNAQGVPAPDDPVAEGFTANLDRLEAILIGPALAPEERLAKFVAALPPGTPVDDQTYLVDPAAKLWDRFLVATLRLATGKPVLDAVQARLSSALRVAAAIFATRSIGQNDLDIRPFAMASIRIETDLLDPAKLRDTSGARDRVPTDPSARTWQDSLVSRLAILVAADGELRRLLLDRSYDVPAPPVVPANPGAAAGADAEAKIEAQPLLVTVQDNAIAASTRNLLITEYGAVQQPGHLDGIDIVRTTARVGRELCEIGATLFGAANSAQIRHATQQIGLLQADLKALVQPDPAKIARLGLMLPPPALGTPANPGKAAAGSVQVLGVGDLKIVKQVLLRYDPGEVANIENVLTGQTKERVHSVKQSTEDTLVVEQEKSTSSEKDLQSTDRFELSDEAQNSIKEERQNEAGVTVTASYGPVSISANTKFSDTSSQEQSSKVSRQFAREIINKSVEKVEQKVREERTRKTTIEIEETNKYTQTAMTKSVVGIYRWVDKIYRAQVYTYGKRMMLEFLIPEPAAVYLHSLANTPVDPGGVKEPDPFVIRASDITPYNYTGLAAQYGAEVDDPPPSVNVQKYALRSNSDTQATNVTLDDGWYGVTASASASFVHQPGGMLYVQLGDGMWDSRQGNWYSQYIGGEAVGAIPLAVTTLNVSAYNVMGKVASVPSDALMGKWRLKTYKAIHSAYELRLSEYREYKASLQRNSGATPVLQDQASRIIEQRELKRSCLEILTAQHFDGPGAIVSNPASGWPEIDLSAAANQGKTVSFFEQSFEWDQITYNFYPYFWGRQSEWETKLAANGGDQIFTRFLSAGYARVAVPVRPAHESDVAFFLATGVIWSGAEPPSIGDPRYVAVVEEVKESLDAPDGGVPEGDPWRVKVPTSLVILDDTGELPNWPDESPGQGSFAPSQDTCGGIPYNAAQWKDAKTIADAIRKLGYAIDAAGDQQVALRKSRSTVRAMQARFNQLGVEAAVGRAMVTDGLVGPCTLRALTYFDALRAAGKWPGVG